MILPSLGKVYEITHVTEDPATEAWVQESYCSPGASQARIVPLESTVAEGDYIGGSAEVNNFFAFLKC